MRILVAEDDARIARSLVDALEMADFAVESVGDGEEAWFRGDTEEYDAIILDLGLPTIDGLTTLKRWRKAERNMPVLILTARGHWEERVEGIEAGADDYVAKPFRPEEVIARIRAIIRRSNGHASTRFEIGNLSLDTQSMTVRKNDDQINVTPMEYRLLQYLVHRKGQVISQLELVEHLYAQDFDRDSNSVEVLIGRLRKKLGKDVIRNKRGFGYYVGEEPH